MNQTVGHGDKAIGGRIRRARMSQGMSQADLARAVSISSSYLSLIESGRRPASDSLLAKVCLHLGVTLDRLRTDGPGDSSVVNTSDDLELKFAEMALRNGDADVAYERYAAIVASLDEASLSVSGFEARLGLAKALEARGEVVVAIEKLEVLRSAVAESELAHVPAHTRLGVALCRLYRECGDLARAIEVGESAMASFPEASSRDPEVLETEVQIVSTLAGCYFERGDLTRAHILTKAALARADSPVGLPLARAAAYWNASAIAEARGEILDAHRYVDRARAIYAESDNLRAVALLKLVSGWLLLQEPEPRLEEAERLIRSALDQLPTVGTEIDQAYGEVELARCRMLSGDPGEAVSLAERAVERLEGGAQLQGARARLTVGQARLLLGEGDEALAVFKDAAADLRSLGGGKQAASAWRELAEILSSLGRSDDALDAYREATNAAGIAAPLAKAARLHAAKGRP